MKLSVEETSVLRRAKKFIWAKEQEIKAICKPGFEDIAIFELTSFGINKVEKIDKGTILIYSKLDNILAIHPYIQTVVRFKLILFKFKSDTAKKFENHIANFHWELIFKEPIAPKIFSSLHHCRLFIKDKTEESIKWGIKKRFNNFFNETVELKESNQQIFIYGKDDEFEVSLDLSGDGFYKKGFRKYVQNSPLRESDVAAILYSAKFFDYKHIIEPMCGSAVFSIEALTIAKQIKSGKDFPFMELVNFKESRYNFDVNNLQCSTNFKVEKCFASDLNDYCVKTATANIINSDMLNFIEIDKKDFFDIDFSVYDDSLIVLNPPYGKRVPQSDIINFYKKIVAKLSQQNFVIIIPAEIKKELRIKTEKEIKFINGGIETVIMFFQLPVS